MPVSWSNLILIPLIFNLAAISICWICYGLRVPGWRKTTYRERIYRCSICEHVYVDARGVPLSRCPRCGCLNEPVRI
jgi:hypothetical protein